MQVHTFQEGEQLLRRHGFVAPVHVILHAIAVVEVGTDAPSVFELIIGTRHVAVYLRHRWGRPLAHTGTYYQQVVEQQCDDE